MKRKIAELCLREMIRNMQNENIICRHDRQLAWSVNNDRQYRLEAFKTMVGNWLEAFTWMIVRLLDSLMNDRRYWLEALIMIVNWLEACFCCHLGVRERCFSFLDSFKDIVNHFDGWFQISSLTFRGFEFFIPFFWGV